MRHMFLCFILLGLALPGFTQSMSNTQTSIDLTGTCIQAGLTSGSYTLDLSYYDIINNQVNTIKALPVTVTVSGSVLHMETPVNSFPSSSVPGGYDLADAWPGQITLTKSGIHNVMFFDLGSNGSLTFNCFALPNIFGSFFISSGSTANTSQLSWVTLEEENSTFIEIWRSPTDSAHSFYKVGQVTAAGFSSTAKFYQFKDSNLDVKNYYYLKILTPGAPSIYSDTTVYVCSTCVYTPPTPDICGDSISGLNHICAVGETELYRLSTSVPNFSTILWSVDNPASARVTYMDDPAQVSLRRTGAPALITLRAIRSGCTDTITKVLSIGSPVPTVNHITKLCPIQMSVIVNSIPSSVIYNYHITNDSTHVRTNLTGTGGNFLVRPFLNNASYTLSVTNTNACGTSDSLVISHLNCLASSSVVNSVRSDVSASLTPDGAVTGVVAVRVAPNPALGMIGISLEEGSLRHRIYQVQVVDALGIVRKRLSYPEGLETMQVDLSGFNNGVYIIRVFDKKSWKSTKVVLVK